jgi:putative ABC transport system permease protein
MIFNYLKLAIRLLIRTPFFTMVNLVCLSIGFSMFLMLWQHAQTELHSDQYHRDFERIVRIGITWNWTDDGAKWDQAKFGTSVSGATKDFVDNFGDFEAGLEVCNQGMFESKVLGHKNDLYVTCVNERNEKNRFLETNIAYADSNLFHFFSIPLIEGDAKNALNGLRATVLSQSTAIKYFGNVSPVGKVIYLNDSLPLTVTGVFKDLPSNTHLNFCMVISTLHLGLGKVEDFQFAHGYLKLKEGITVAGLKKKLDLFTNKSFGPMMKERNGKLKVETFLQPLKDIPFSNLTNDRFTAKSKHFLYIIEILSFVILAMAWVNYVNLARANNQHRLRELGARKTVGASTSDFVKQFLLEAALINVISFMAALTLIQVMRNPAIAFFEFRIDNWSDIDLSSWMVALTALLSGILITGLYPAWVTIKSSPKTLFGRSKKTIQDSPLSTVLTTLQYCCAIVLIAWVMSINSQLKFIFSRNIGINQENVVVVELPFKRDANFASSLAHLTQRVETSPAVAGAASSSSVVGDVYVNSMSMVYKAGSIDLGIDSNGGVDENFIPFYEINLIAGRNFSPTNASDVNSIIISRVVTKRLGFSVPEDALGIELERPKARVIGIIEDYALHPLLSEFATSIHGVRGIALLYGNSIYSEMVKNKLAVKFKSGMTDEGMAMLRREFAAVFPAAPFQSYFLDNHINQYYTGEKIFLQQITLFTGIAIFIACLGLLGMMRIKVLDYAKQIALRKIMGAKLYQLGRLLLSSAIAQVAVATILALPVSYYLDMQYLTKFTERIALSWWHYVLPIAVFLTLLLCSIASLILQAARANPVDALRHE